MKNQTVSYILPLQKLGMGFLPCHVFFLLVIDLEISVPPTPTANKTHEILQCSHLCIPISDPCFYSLSFYCHFLHPASHPQTKLTKIRIMNWLGKYLTPF
uniref:Uncharacterized protein n=1 Tax=Coturnix japonica TaxID=93934 RepID=A0A8C2TDI0_COTJA